MKKLNSILWGVVLIAIGVIWGLNTFEITNIDIFFDGWWTLFIIVPCTIGLFSEREKTGNFIGLLIGVLLLLCCQDVLSFSMLWKLIVPAIIIIIGAKIIFNAIFGNKTDKIIRDLRENGGEFKSRTAIFSGQKLDFSGSLFEGAEMTAIFGGVKCDLTTAVIDKDCVINGTAIFGGIDILVPDYVNVKINSNSVFGGISDKKRGNSKENTVTLYIDGTCIFGGIDIK